MSFEKSYEPAKHERDIYRLWENQKAFSPRNRGSKKSFSIVVPPPNANGDLHIGHGLTLAVEDIAVRYHRMKGESALLLPGADHAGFETQVVYEKYLAKAGKSRFDFSREELYKQIWDFVATNKDNYQDQFRKLGASVDWDRYVFTLDKKIVNRAYDTFKKMWDDGLIYRGERLVNFCTYHGTGFADIEVDYKQSKGHLWHIRYPLTSGEGEVVVATTRPETMLGDVAVAVHPEDTRYKKLVGKTVTLPLTNREIPILADDFVDMEYGTGAVKITPAHDQNDYDMAERHDLPKISVISHEGTITHDAPEQFVGLDVPAARDKIINELSDSGYLIKTDEIEHSVGHCYKCGTVIEPLLREQWFIDVKPLAKNAIKALKNKEITFYPDQKRTQLITYLENLRDWNISRQIAWGIPIPAFQSSEDPSEWIFDTRVEQETITVNGVVYHRDHDVFDTWFSSSSWPYATLDFPHGEDFAKFYPLSVMETGADILYPWVSRMIMFGLYNTGKIPFENVYLHGLVLDPHGQKMSKSKGNVVNPMDKVNEFGSDAFRMGIIAGQSAGNNQPYAEDKVVGARNFCNKLWNLGRYISENTHNSESPTAAPTSLADHWILSRLNSCITAVSAYLDDYRFGEAYETLYHFVWDDFADWYIESSKADLNATTLQFVYQNILLLAHPFAPFVTEAIWQKLGWSEELLAISSWPQSKAGDSKKTKEFERLRTVVQESRRLCTAVGIKNPILQTASDLIIDNSALVQKLAGLAKIEQTEKGNGLRLATPELAWLDIPPETIAHYKTDLEERAQAIQMQIDRLEARLSNVSYTKNAPAHIVAQTQDELANTKRTFNIIASEIKQITTGQ